MSKMEALMKYFPMHMDYEGQERAEKICRIIILLFATIGFIWGYVIQQFSQTVLVLGAGFLLAVLITVPPWPIYRKKPLKWQKPKPIVEGADTAKKPKASKK